MIKRQARSVYERYGFGVYILTVEDYQDYLDGDIFDVAQALYKGYSLGAGAEKDGLLLLLSMEDRDYSIITHGDVGNYAFNDEGRSAMTAFFLDNFAQDDWQGGFSDYIAWSDKYLKAAENETPFSESFPPLDDTEKMKAIGIRIAIVVVVPLIVAGIVIFVLRQKMKSVAKQTEASTYKVDELNLTTSLDRFSHTTETRRLIKTESSSSGNSSKSSGGFSGTSGKF